MCVCVYTHTHSYRYFIELYMSASTAQDKHTYTCMLALCYIQT